MKPVHYLSAAIAVAGGMLSFWALGALIGLPDWYFPYRVGPVLTLGIAMSVLGWLGLLFVPQRHDSENV